MVLAKRHVKSTRHVTDYVVTSISLCACYSSEGFQQTMTDTEGKASDQKTFIAKRKLIISRDTVGSLFLFRSSKDAANIKT